MKVVELPPHIIDEGDRYREDYGNIEDLADSVKEKGFIQPITVQHKDDGNYRLIAGGRRLKAALLLSLNTIPCVIREIHDEADLREVELFENVFRKNLSWQEESRLECEIYRLKGRSYRELADELDTAKSTLARNVALGEAMELIPELANKKTADDAWKAYNAIHENLVVEELTKRAGLDIPDLEDEGSRVPGSDNDEASTRGIPTPRGYKAASACYRLEDALEGLDSLSTYIFDFAEVDPPYGIDLQRAKRSGGESSTLDSYTEVDANDYEDFLDEVASSVYSVLKDNSFCIWWYGHQWYEQVVTSLRRRGFSVNPIPGIWVKPHGQTKQPDTNLASCYEPFIIARKGKPRLVKSGRSNVFTFDPVAPASKIHATQRPLNLIQELLDTFCLPGSKVVSPFLGSGTTLRACWTRSMIGMGWDLDKTIRNKFLLQVQEDTEKGRYEVSDGQSSSS